MKTKKKCERCKCEINKDQGKYCDECKEILERVFYEFGLGPDWVDN